MTTFLLLLFFLRKKSYKKSLGIPPSQSLSIKKREGYQKNELEGGVFQIASRDTKRKKIIKKFHPQCTEGFSEIPLSNIQAYTHNKYRVTNPLL